MIYIENVDAERAVESFPQVTEHYRKIGQLSLIDELAVNRRSLRSEQMSETNLLAAEDILAQARYDLLIARKG